MNDKLHINAATVRADADGTCRLCDMELPDIGWIAWKWFTPPERQWDDEEQLRAARGALATGRFVFSPHGIPQLPQ